MGDAENKKIIARNIKKFMEIKGVNNREFCDALGFKYTTFMDWINGVTYPRIGKIEMMANYFGCEKADLIEDRHPSDMRDDTVSDMRRALMQFAQTVPEDKADLALRLLQTILEDNKKV